MWVHGLTGTNARLPWGRLLGGGGRRLCGAGGIWEISAPPAQSSCESKTTLKDSLIIKNIN